MSILDKSSPIQLQNGLNKDLTYQRPGDVTFALNAIRDSHDGGKFEYQSEPGNELVEGLPNGYTFMGSINGISNEVYIFAANGSNGTIGIFKEGKYTEVVRTTFGWNPAYPITGEFKVREGCERVIYWCNGNSPDGYFNFDSIDDFKTSGVFDVNKFKLTPNISPPKIELVSVNDSGGIIPLGSYYFQAEILDANLNSIYKTDISPQTVIYDESQSDAYTNIDGGFNFPQYPTEIGGVPQTSKSITLRLFNLDTSFQYIRINVARQITGNLAIDAHAVGNLIPITTSSITWTYTGLNVSNGDYPLDYSEMLNNNIRYNTSYVMEQVQGRLLRAGVKQDIRDYANYQKFASLITAEWVAKEIDNKDAFTIGNPKNPKTYWECTSFQGDEVYAFGIQYLFKDGTWSPVMPLIGRKSITFDNDLLTVVANSTPSPTSSQVWESDVEHLGLTIGQTVARWKIRNTATITTSNTVTHPYNYAGTFGYYESNDTTYPNLKDCDDNFIWGVDSTSTAITNTTKLRYFRFPDRKLIPHLNGDGQYAVPLGVKFENITYPDSDVVGHRFVHAIRDDSNKTVIDSGWAVQPDITTPTYGDTISLGANFAMYNDAAGEGYVRYNSANIFFNSKLFNPDHIKLNTAYHIKAYENGEEIEINNILGFTDLHVNAHTYKIENKASPNRSLYKVDNQAYVESNSYTSASLFDLPIKSEDFFVDDSVMKLSYKLEDPNAYLPAQVMGTPAGPALPEHNMFYIYKKNNINPYQNLLGLNYNYINFNHAVIADPNEFYNGDILISLSAPTRGDLGVGGGADLYFRGYNYNTFYEEHEFNTSLRHSGTDINNKYYHGDGNIELILDMITTSIVQEDGDILYQLRGKNDIKEYFVYNLDYNIQSLEHTKVGIPLTYNYCSDCIGKFDNYIIFSPKSFDEESFDLFRINKVNDYISMPAHRGRITGLKYQNNYLLVHTEDSLFILQPNPQALATDISSVYLTTGDFLSIPPQEIMQTDIGYAGMQSKQHMCETPQGHAWCDQKRGQIFMFNTKLEELSTENNGMSQWFRQELPSYLAQSFYNNYEVPYPNTSTYDSNFNGIGIIMYYDPRFKRLLISKKDYNPVDYSTTHYDFATNMWKYIPNMDRAVYFSNTTSFENRSWTISYSFITNTWTSWHSYRPAAAFSDDSHYYTLATTPTEVSAIIQRIYRHKYYKDYQKYFGTKYDFIVEWMTNDSSTDVLSTIHYQGYSLSWDDVNKQWKPEQSTFDRGIFYNYNQSTGLVTLQLMTSPYGNIRSSNTVKNIIKTDENYKISGLYDILVTNPPMTNSWTLVKTYPSYIDQVPFTANHNVNTSAYKLNNIKNKFVLCRLYYKPTQDYKKVINLIQTNEMRSIR